MSPTGMDNASYMNGPAPDRAEKLVTARHEYDRAVSRFREAFTAFEENLVARGINMKAAINVGPPRSPNVPAILSFQEHRGRWGFYLSYEAEGTAGASIASFLNAPFSLQLDAAPYLGAVVANLETVIADRTEAILSLAEGIAKILPPTKKARS